VKIASVAALALLNVLLALFPRLMASMLLTHLLVWIAALVQVLTLLVLLRLSNYCKNNIRSVWSGYFFVCILRNLMILL
jgi:hypothetical protein